MARSVSASLIVLLAAATIGCAAAARPEPAVNAGHWATSLGDSGLTELSYSALAAHEGDSGKGDEGPPFRLLTKFIIRPSISKEFAKGWLKYKKEAEKAKGAKHIGLGKPLSDNIVFWGYEEWESKADFFKWVKSEDSAAKILAFYIEEKDIPVVITQLVNVTPPPHHHGHHHGGHHHHHHHQSWMSGVHANMGSAAKDLPLEEVTSMLADITDTEEGRIGTAAGIHGVSSTSSSGRWPLSSGDEHEFSPVVLTRVLVKPSELFRFIAASNLFAKAVAEHEKGNRVFRVSKSLDNDSEFFVYAEWESKDALKEHVEAGYAKLFRQYALDHDVFVKNSLLLRIEDKDE